MIFRNTWFIKKWCLLEVYYCVAVLKLKFLKHFLLNKLGLISRATCWDLKANLSSWEKWERLKEVWRECWTESNASLKMYFKRNTSALYINHISSMQGGNGKSSENVDLVKIAFHPSICLLCTHIYIYVVHIYIYIRVLILFYVMSALPACMYAYHMCARCPWKSEEDVGYSGACHLGAGNRGRVTCKNK